ncbi:CBS and ACT domain-containing protein [Paradesulfitobacterium ferrireducens]|uniref:CBS and ACT domain-containing protein n=1 Tax=Paradesulfitobacterium ferrireducens TaxID=2816476 RepID=UPI001A8C34E5|nr:CBS domain-containing protein [Paradesulfitobacterium ferrireducens]
MFVRQLMTTDVITVAPTDTIADTMALMREKKVNRLPVIENGKLVGLVTDGDLREVSPSPATTLSIFELNYLVAKTTIREIAVKHVITCGPDTRIEDAALVMRDHKIGGLPVVENGSLVGIITESDVFGAFLNILGLRSPGDRIVVEATDKVGVMCDVATTIKEYGVNIASLAIYHPSTEKIKILLRLNGEKVEEVEKALAAKGYILES